MLAKAVLVVCAQAFLVQAVFGVCGGCGGYGLGYNGLADGYGLGLAGGYGTGYGCGAGVASTGGGLAVTSASPIAPVGISVRSDNAYEGQLCAGGNLPFLGSVGVEGVLPTGGAGAVSYGCGDGAIGIGSEGPIYTGVATPGAIFPPTSPSPAATEAIMVLGNGLGGNGYGIAGAGYGYGYGNIAGYGLGYNRDLGCGCGL